MKKHNKPITTLEILNHRLDENKKPFALIKGDKFLVKIDPQDGNVFRYNVIYSSIERHPVVQGILRSTKEQMVGYNISERKDEKKINVFLPSKSYGSDGSNSIREKDNYKKMTALMKELKINSEFKDSQIYTFVKTLPNYMYINKKVGKNLPLVQDAFMRSINKKANRDIKSNIQLEIVKKEFTTSTSKFKFNIHLQNFIVVKSAFSRDQISRIQTAGKEAVMKVIKRKSSQKPILMKKGNDNDLSSMRKELTKYTAKTKDHVGEPKKIKANIKNKILKAHKNGNTYQAKLGEGVLEKITSSNKKMIDYSGSIMDANYSMKGTRSLIIRNYSVKNKLNFKELLVKHPEKTTIDLKKISECKYLVGLFVTKHKNRISADREKAKEESNYYFSKGYYPYSLDSIENLNESDEEKGIPMMILERFNKTKYNEDKKNFVITMDDANETHPSGLRFGPVEHVRVENLRKYDLNRGIEIEKVKSYGEIVEFDNGVKDLAITSIKPKTLFTPGLKVSYSYLLNKVKTKFF